MKNIKHTGVVEQVDGMRLKVRIRQTSACAACSAKAHCNASETKEKLIDVRNERGIPCHAGQEVVICGAASMGMKAVGWAFALPFAVVVASLFAAIKLTGGNEPLSAVVALAMLVPYYLALRLCRRWLGRSFVFTLESVN
ncbi:SoxR reducing system RseC family protein [Phocaeicola sp.]|uniref:SoxR reducing system RseC family protein n=1 Tax=Phocaeicola sp. TaxID=2773926 RepID=UPI003AB5A3DA